MSVTLRPKLQTIRDWIDTSALELRNIGIESALLDAEIILAHTIRRPRTWLHAHDDEWLEPRQREIADARIRLRLDRTPIAYIVGHKEFYGRQFIVSPSVLIPRPESEAIITSLHTHMKTSYKRLADVGAGSGCLAVTAALEFSQLDVLACDIDTHALAVAKRNAMLHHAPIKCIKSDLLSVIMRPVDIIIANLPYVDTSWQRSPELRFEPDRALYATKGGLHFINQLVTDVDRLLTKDGLLILEADLRQHRAIMKTYETAGYTHLATDGLILTFQNA